MIKKTIFYILTGLPYSGKTTLGRAISEVEEIQIIELDSVLYEMGQGLQGEYIPEHKFTLFHEEAERRAIKQLKAGISIVWWSQKSRQFLVENKTKHNYSRKLVLSARIDLRWRLIVQRLMKPLLIVKREVRSQIAYGFGNALVIFDVHLLIFHTAP